MLSTFVARGLVLRATHAEERGWAHTAGTFKGADRAEATRSHLARRPVDRPASAPVGHVTLDPLRAGWPQFLPNRVPDRPVLRPQYPPLRFSYGVQPNAQRRTSLNQMCVQFLYLCVFITAGPSTKLFAWGGGDVGGHVPRETTSRGLCGLVCPSRTSELLYFAHGPGVSQ